MSETTTTEEANKSSSMQVPVLPPHRRPRVREVSSRFMSPVVSSSTTSGDHHHHHHHLHLLPAKSPLAHTTKHAASTPQHQHQHQRSNSVQRRRHLDLESLSSSDENRSDKYQSPPNLKCKTRTLPDLRSSMPEADVSPTTTATSRLLPHRNFSRANSSSIDSSKFSSPCSRSLNLPLMNCENTLLYHSHSIKTSEKRFPPCTKQQHHLPLDAAARKGRKVSSHQEGAYSLRLLHNYHLQWRYANSKTDASMHAQKIQSEKMLYSLGVKISDLYDSVTTKRIQLELLQRTRNLSTVLDAQMQYLDEWSALEGDYSISLSDTIQALVNASLQVPISGNVRADIKEAGEALNSALKVMEMIAVHVQSLRPKAEKMENLISELAKVIGEERTLVEECGHLLPKTYSSQVEECSLRGQLIQFQLGSLVQTSDG